jgi:hypothetical protein
MEHLGPSTGICVMGGLRRDQFAVSYRHAFTAYSVPGQINQSQGAMAGDYGNRILLDDGSGNGAGLQPVAVRRYGMEHRFRDGTYEAIGTVQDTYRLSIYG